MGGFKKLPDMKEKVKKNSEKKSNQGAKRNKKMGGRSHVITFGVFPFKNGTLYCTVNTIPDAIYGEHYRVIPSRKGYQPKPVFGYKKNYFF